MKWTENTIHDALEACRAVPEEGEEFYISATEEPFWIPAKAYLGSAIAEIQRLHKEAATEANKQVIEDLREWLGRLAVDRTEFSEEVRMFEILLDRFEADRNLEQWMDKREAWRA